MIIHNKEELEELLLKEPRTEEEEQAIKEYLYNEQLANMRRENTDDLVNPFNNNQNTSQTVKIPDELKNIPEISNIESDYENPDIGANSNILPGTSDFLESGAHDEGPKPPIDDLDTDVDVTTDLEVRNDEELLTEALNKEEKSDDNTSPAYIVPKVEDNDNKTEEKPKNKLSFEVSNEEKVKAITESDIESIEESNKDLNLENLESDKLDENKLLEDALNEVEEELKQESIKTDESDEKSMKFEVVDSKSKGLTEKESKIIENLENKRNEIKARIVSKKELMSHTSYSNKYYNPLCDSQIEEDKIVSTTTFSRASDENQLKTIAKQWERTLPTGNKTLIALPLSGISVVIRSYNNADILGLIEKMRVYSERQRKKNRYDSCSAWIEQRKAELESIFDHIEYVVIDNSKYPAEGENPRINITPSFNEFLEMIKYPDLEQLFFAAFDATYRDKNKYTLDCYNVVRNKETGQIQECGNEFEYYTSNENLCYIPNKYITPEEFGWLKNGFPAGQKASELKIVRAADSEHKVVTKNKYLFKLKIPSLADYLRTLDVLLIQFSQNKNGLDEVDIRNIDNMPTPYKELNLMEYMLKICLFTKTLIKPKVELKTDASGNVMRNTDGTEVANVIFESVEEKSDIISFILRFDLDTIKEIAKNKGFKALVRFKGIQHYIMNAHCDKCNSELDPIPVNMEDIFFSISMEKATL